MPSLPGHAVDATREGILEDNIAPPASWLPLPGHFSLQGCGYRAVSGRCGYQRIICPRKSAPRAVFVLFREFMGRVSVVFMAGAQLGELMAENWHEQLATLQACLFSQKLVHPVPKSRSCLQINFNLKQSHVGANDPLKCGLGHCRYSRYSLHQRTEKKYCGGKGGAASCP